VGLHNRSKSQLFFWGLYDWAASAYSVIIVTFVFSSYFVNAVAPNKVEGVSLLGLALGFAGFAVAIGGPFLGACADQIGNRKHWMGFLTTLCVICTALMWFILPEKPYTALGMLLIALGTITSEYSYIFYNAMLPTLADSERMGRWSGWGWAMGYGGGLVSLTLCLLLFIEPEHSFFHFDKAKAQDVRATFVFAALWFGLFSIPFFLYIPSKSVSRQLPLKTIFSHSFQQLWQTFLEMKNEKTIGRFLIGRMIYTDALITLFAFGGVYAMASFQMKENEVLLFGISLNISAGIGAGIFAMLDDRFGGKKMIIAALVGLIICGIWAISAINEIEFWVAGFVLGLFVGPVQASSRSYFARIIPSHKRHEMFGFFALSAKATSFLGPMTVSWLTYLTGSIRLGMYTIIIYLVIGLVIILPIDRDK
jgi:MFS transporter, UMF1 family